MSKRIEKLISQGCKIVDETDDTVILNCPGSVLEKQGVVIPDNKKNIILVFQKKVE
ncbi:MAG: hypothetical protein ACE5J4_02275 [Candidatus Aenigmatarchaeota archaeon]